MSENNGRLAAMRRFRCPHCLEGAVFATFWRMDVQCEVCGIVYEREPGYFLVSIFMGYVLNFMIIIPVGLIWYFAQLPTLPVLIGLSIFLILVAPWIFRYGRILWLHLDELMDPRDG